MSHVPYDDFADIYDAWCGSAPITESNHGYYVRKLVESRGPVAELGVGNGRICIEVAKQGRPVTGVDSSGAILELCRKRAREAGVEGRLSLIQADFRDFVLPAPADLIVLPFHSIGHLLTDDDKLRAMKQVRSQLRDGGRFLFDHFLFDPSFVQPGVPRLRAEFRNPETGRDHILWETSTHDLEHQVIPDEVTLTGTIRTFDPELRRSMPDRISRIASGVTTGLGCRAEVEVRAGNPPVINDASAAEIARRAAVRVVGEHKVVPPEPTMGGEDMAVYFEKAPGCFVFVGSANPATGKAEPHHSPRFDFDEDALAIGCEFLIQAAEEALRP